MSLSIIDKYVSKKKKDLLEYAKILESLISVNDNKWWQNKKEFSVIAKEIIEIYADAYYFQNNLHKENPIEYLNDNINFVLKSIIEYSKKHDLMSNIKVWRNETFLASVIICTSCYVDFASNVVDGDFKDTKDKFKYLLSYLRKTSVLLIKDNKYFVNDLFDALKKNISEDEKIVSDLFSDDYYNEYKMISNNPSMYEVIFHYNILELSKYDEVLVKKILKEYDNKLMEMSYELLTVTILRELISNRVMNHYVINIDNAMKKVGIIRMFDNNYLKEFVSIKVLLDDEIKYNNIIKSYKDIGFNIIYEVTSSEEVDPTTLADGTTLLVSREFLVGNKNNEEVFKKMDIKLIVKNKED